MATQLKLKYKEEELSKERKLAGNAKRFLEIRVEELEKKLKVSPGFLLCTVRVRSCMALSQ